MPPPASRCETPPLGRADQSAPSLDRGPFHSCFAFRRIPVRLCSPIGIIPASFAGALAGLGPVGSAAVGQRRPELAHRRSRFGNDRVVLLDEASKPIGASFGGALVEVALGLPFFVAALLNVAAIALAVSFFRRIALPDRCVKPSNL